MFKTKLIAMLLCLTTVFATFAGVSFAEDGVDEETIVIENGKVVSGNRDLVDQGVIVIVDEDDASAEEPMTLEEKIQFILDNKANFFKPISGQSSNEGVATPNEAPNAVSPSRPTQGTSAIPEGTDAPTVDDVNLPAIGGISLSTATPNYTGFMATIGDTNTTVDPWLNAPSTVNGETVRSQRTLKYTHTRIKITVFIICISVFP